MKIHKTELPEIYTLFEPESGALPLMIDSPHSGRAYPSDYNFSCDFKMLKSCEDNQLEVLLQDTPTYGATYLQCEFPRSYIDVNRAADDIDPALLRELPVQPIAPTPRSSAGYGLLRRLIKPGYPVYDRLLELTDLNHRLNSYYFKYHNMLQKKIDALHYNFGQVFYLNMHSMPATSAHTEDGHPVDFVLGDRYGTTCRRDFVQEMKHFLEHLGYRVALNDPYKGVELIARHGHPAVGRNALQVEINKNLYWNEKKQELLPAHQGLKAHLNDLFAFTVNFIEKELVQRAAD